MEDAILCSHINFVISRQKNLDVKPKHQYRLVDGYNHYQQKNEK
uniref:Uncharacterized protein n=1 Tax=viral metagenome TaxID=1070528 RepID=A0A6C0JU26_9ZZZZ